MNEIDHVPPDPEQGIPVFGESNDLYGQTIHHSDNLPRAPLIYVVIGAGTFIITALIIWAGIAIFNSTHVRHNVIAVVPDNTGALQAAQNDSGLLLMYKPGDTWTFEFSRHNEEVSGPEAYQTGEIIEKVVQSSINGRPCLVDTAEMNTTNGDGTKSRTTSTSCERQGPNGTLYLLGYGDNPTNLHWNTTPELLAKGDWNVDPSFDIKTETIKGTPSHTFVTVAPEPTVLELSTGTPVKCWNKTIAVTAGSNYNETTTELYCPAIGQKVSSTDVVIFPDSFKSTTTIQLTHFSLTN